MWTLDPERDRELIEQLRAHARSPDILRVAVGEGWRDLVRARFPDPPYDLQGKPPKRAASEDQGRP